MYLLDILVCAYKYNKVYKALILQAYTENQAACKPRQMKFRGCILSISSQVYSKLLGDCRVLTGDEIFLGYPGRLNEPSHPYIHVTGLSEGGRGMMCVIPPFEVKTYFISLLISLLIESHRTLFRSEDPPPFCTFHTPPPPFQKALYGPA